MTRFTGTTILSVGLIFLGGTARSDEAQVKQVLDKAVKALGGEEKLSKAKTLSIKGKGKVTIEGNENAMKTETTVQGLDHYASTFEGEFNGNAFKGRSVLKQDKGWRRFGEQSMEMEPDAVKNEKRTIYLMVVPTTILPLRTKDFKVESAADATVAGKPAATLKITGPDGKDFTLSFDKESGLPVRLVAKVAGWMGEEYVQDVSYGDYKDFDGLKKCIKMTIKRDGEEFVTQEVTEFKVLDSVPAATFDEPK